MDIDLLKWLSEAPFGEDTYFMVSMNTLQEIEEIGLHVVSRISRPLEPSNVAVLGDSNRTLGGKKIIINLITPDNEFRIFNPFGLQAVFLLRPPSRDLKTPQPNVVKWPSPQINI